jgi:hypothetical protein
MEEIVAKVKFNVSRNADDDPASQILEDPLAECERNH